MPLDVVEFIRAHVSRKHVAAGVQHALAGGLAARAVEVAQDRGISVVGASGGVFYNRAITLAVQDVVANSGLKFVRHELLPAGDGGISVGQAVTAGSQ